HLLGGVEVEPRVAELGVLDLVRLLHPLEDGLPGEPVAVGPVQRRRGLGLASPDLALPPPGEDVSEGQRQAHRPPSVERPPAIPQVVRPRPGQEQDRKGDQQDEAQDAGSGHFQNCPARLSSASNSFLSWAGSGTWPSRIDWKYWQNARPRAK